MINPDHQPVVDAGRATSGTALRRVGRTWAITFVLAALAVITLGVWIAKQPRVGPPVEVAGTLEIAVTAEPDVRWKGVAVICERSPYDGLVSNLRSPNVGSLGDHTLWTVLQLDFPGSVVLAIGQAGPARPSYDPTGEYGGGVPAEQVQQAPDRARGSLTFRLPLAKGVAFELAGVGAFLSGSLTWTCDDLNG